MSYNIMVYNFPMVSGLKVVLGCAIAGFFLSLDTALERERAVIRQAYKSNRFLSPPKRLYPMTRKFLVVALAAALFVAAIIGLVIASDVTWLAQIGQSGMSLAQAQRSVTYEVFFVMIVLLAWVVNLIVSYSKNLKLLFENETNVLERVSTGDLSKLVPVATNDEFGVIAGHTNTMINRLRHRTQLLTALKLAEEVQQNLLPQEPPSLVGLDVSGISKYCDETGGDYYDYLVLPKGSLGVVVADVSEHGVGAALLMTTARALIRQRAAMSGDIARVVSDVNQELYKDVRETGRFMTMFFMEIDVSSKTLRWVRAGHDPAIFYDAGKDKFDELAGEGMALGVDKNIEFQEFSRRGWVAGSVIVAGTDGIREAINVDGEMFGQDRLRQTIQKNVTHSADAIQKAIMNKLSIFQGDTPQQDDMTLVVVKLL
ncbi:MAG: SpoIIE family protein phosphatase [Deltaproteobacteria bacterium]|nr:SpoIIE family protein phosphatase [Deltaproteobacteria bacterium]